jgi:hypothetical protein
MPEAPAIFCIGASLRDITLQQNQKFIGRGIFLRAS